MVFARHNMRRTHKTGLVPPRFLIALAPFLWESLLPLGYGPLLLAPHLPVHAVAILLDNVGSHFRIDIILHALPQPHDFICVGARQAGPGSGHDDGEEKYSYDSRHVLPLGFPGPGRRPVFYQLFLLAGIAQGVKASRRNALGS